MVGRGTNLQRGTWVFFKCRSPYDAESTIKYFEKVLGVTLKQDQLDATSDGFIVSFSKDNLASVMDWLIEGHQFDGEMVRVSFQRGKQY